MALFTGSTLPILVGSAFFLVLAVVSFPSTTSTRLMGAALVLAPDLLTIAHVSGSPVTARTGVFLLLEGGTLVALLRARLSLKVPARLLVLALAFTGVVGALQNGRAKSLPEFFALIVLPIIVGSTLASDRRIARDFLVGLTSGTLVLCVIGLVEAGFDHVFSVSSTSVYADTFIRAGHVRATAGWAFPTEFSAFLCLTGFFVVEAFHRRWGTTGMILGGALITAAVIATQSRSGLAGLVAGAVAYLLLQRRLGQGLRVLGALGVAVALLLVVPGAAPESFRRFVGQSLTPGSGAHANVTYRQELYHDASVAMAHHPLFGYGYGSGKSVATNSLHAYFGDLTDLASLPVSLSVQLGYVGTITCTLLLLGALVRLARRVEAMARLPLAAGLVGSAVAMGGVPLSSPVSVLLLLVGMAWQLTTRSPEADPRLTEQSIAAAGHAGRSSESVDRRGHVSNSLPT